MENKEKAPKKIWLEYSSCEQNLHMTDDLVWTGYLTEYVRAENYDRLVEALKLSMLGLEAMIEDGRCGDTFTATALHLDKCNALLAQLDTKGEE